MAASGGRPVAALSLSMGSTYFGLFLRAHVSAAWARRHVASHIAVSGEGATQLCCSCSRAVPACKQCPGRRSEPPALCSVSAGVWGGTLWAPLAVVAGGQDPESQALSPVAQLLEHEPLRALLRALPSLPFLSPAPAVFGDRVLVRGEATGQRFTAGRLGAWLRASGTRGAADVWQASWRFMEGGTRASGSPVPLRCLYGTGVDTAEGVTVLPPSEHGPRRYQLQLG